MLLLDFMAKYMIFDMSFILDPHQEKNLTYPIVLLINNSTHITHMNKTKL